MKRIMMLTILVVTIVVLNVFVGTGQAETFTFSGRTVWQDGYVLNHNWFYWMDVDTNASGLAAKIQSDWTISSAYLQFVGLREMTFDPKNVLYMAFADSKPAGWTSTYGTFKGYWDGEAAGSALVSNTTFTAKDPVALPPEWKDPNYLNPLHPKSNVTRALDVTMINFLTADIYNDGIYAIGLDPDCHFTFDSMDFVIEASAPKVPEPSSLLLFGTGLVGLGFFSIRRKKIG